MVGVGHHCCRLLIKIFSLARVRFGGNSQYWTFLLEVLSVIPEEVSMYASK